MKNNFTDDSSGTKIKVYRLARGMTQEQLAGDAGLAVSTIIRIELGKIRNPGRGTLKAIAKALEVSVGDIM